jgi:membrane protein YdbS with pleckstrin-like domain
MVNARPAPARLISSALSTLVWTAVLAGLWAGFCEILPWLAESQRAQVRWESRQGLLAVAGVEFLGASGALLALLRSVHLRTTRYEVGAANLVIHNGGLWQATRTIPIFDIGRVETFSGPVMRLLGLEDLKVYVNGEAIPTPLHGLPATGEFRTHLLARRESLREAALAGDLSVAKTSSELILERLDRALGRIEERLAR